MVNILLHFGHKADLCEHEEQSFSSDSCNGFKHLAHAPALRDAKLHFSHLPAMSFFLVKKILHPEHGL